MFDCLLEGVSTWGEQASNQPFRKLITFLSMCQRYVYDV